MAADLKLLLRGKQTSLEGTYLAPLVFMTRSHDDEIRRQAVCAIANLAEDQTRPAVALLRNLDNRSVICDLIEFTQPPLDLQKRKDAVVGLTNLMRNRTVHLVMLQEGLLDDILQLSQTSIQARCMIGRGSSKKLTPATPSRSSSIITDLSSPATQRTDSSRTTSAVLGINGKPNVWDPPSMRLIVFGLACLCANETLADELLKHGYAPELMRLAFGIPGLDDVHVRRNAVHALTALSFDSNSRVEIKKLGGLALTTELLQSRDSNDLRWQGAMLACNLCLEPENKRDAVNSPLLAQMLQTALPPLPVGGETEQIALALATLANEQTLISSLVKPTTVRSLLALIQQGSRVSKQHAWWALSNLATHQPTPPCMLSPEIIDALVTCISAEGAPSRATRRDAIRTLSWLCANPEVSPACRRTAGVGSGELLEVVVQCGLTSDPELQDNALLVLSRWAEQIDHHAELVLGGALQPLVLALQHPTEMTQYPHAYGARGLACLSVHRHFRAMIMQAGAAAPLLELMRSPWQRVRCFACRTVCNMSLELAGSLELLRLGGMSPAISVARSSSRGRKQQNDQLAIDYAAKIVTNLYLAWSLEEASAELEERNLAALTRRASGLTEEDNLQVQRKAIRARVAFPLQTLVVTCFNSWRLVKDCSKREQEEMQRLEAANKIQGRARNRKKRKINKQEGAAAANIQSSYRGKKVRSEQLESKLAATKIQSSFRGKSGRRQSSAKLLKKQEATAKYVNDAFSDLQLSVNQALKHISGLQQGENSNKLRLIDIFSRIVSNDDGMVSCVEFEIELKRLNLDVEASSVTKFFEAIDPGTSGYFDFRTFRRQFTTLDDKMATEAQERELETVFGRQASDPNAKVDSVCESCEPEHVFMPDGLGAEESEHMAEYVLERMRAAMEEPQPLHFQPSRVVGKLRRPRAFILSDDEIADGDD